jgi:hypothetical protein
MNLTENLCSLSIVLILLVVSTTAISRQFVHLKQEINTIFDWHNNRIEHVLSYEEKDVDYGAVYSRNMGKTPFKLVYPK